MLSLEETRLAARAGVVALSVDLDKYVELDLDHFRTQMDQLREFFWSARVAQWAPFAGLLAVVRVRRGAIAALLGGWLGAFLVVKGFSTRATIESELLLAAAAARLACVPPVFASIPLLVPTFARRLGERLRTPPSLPWRGAGSWSPPSPPCSSPLPRSPPRRRRRARDAPSFRMSLATSSSRRSTRTWSSRSLATAAGDGALDDGRAVASRRLLPRLSHGRAVLRRRVREHRRCDLGVPLHPLRADRDDPRDDVPGHGTAGGGATYRIGVGTNWIDDPEAGDVFAFSPPVLATD